MTAMALRLTSPPGSEPLTLPEAKDHLRVTHTDEDPLITNLIGASREHVESLTRRALITQTWDLTLDAFPKGEIVVPRPRLISVVTLDYVDDDGAAQTLSSSLYRVDTQSEPGRITPDFGEDWPATRAQTGAVTVTFTAGYGAASAVPEPLVEAIKLHMGAIYARDPDVPVPQDAIHSLISPYFTGHIW